MSVAEQFLRIRDRVRHLAQVVEVPHVMAGVLVEVMPRDGLELLVVNAMDVDAQRVLEARSTPISFQCAE